MSDQKTLTSLAEEFGTPLYVYNRKAIEQAWQEFAQALEGHRHLICYAVKANSNLAILNILARLGSGFDIVSEGELKRVLAAGGEPGKIVFSGVGKSTREMAAALEAGIRCFNVESDSELERLAEVAAAHGVVAPVSLRINPDVDAMTHPYISTGLKENKFGIGMAHAMDTYRRGASLASLNIKGIDCHIGSQLTNLEPYADAIALLIDMVDRLDGEGIHLSHVDIGGGQGIAYTSEESHLNIASWADCVVQAIGDRDLEILVEPGRYIVGQAGVLLTRVEYLKSNEDRHFAVVDAAMNDLIRPALYSAWQGIEEVETLERESKIYDVVGPICESADFLGKQRELAIAQNDLLCVRSSGAYASVMSSNYNTRARAAEVMVSGDDATLVRAREDIDALFANEFMLP
ncbi:Diaminopimelate decarboxylase [Granulosicoccus antarcticus IMCC3135]|uniref:Diaminopimelate decarboxylase n=2 Tax=Granulosicoccus TaxID=437504 RepID=A0A2Z2NSJ4_9GAMM|nr:Diaminopimelate decarboxylase [Granulosicoccus antarcticus IMCC3135]